MDIEGSWGYGVSYSGNNNTIVPTTPVVCNGSNEAYMAMMMEQTHPSKPIGNMKFITSAGKQGATFTVYAKFIDVDLQTTDYQSALSDFAAIFESFGLTVSATNTSANQSSTGTQSAAVLVKGSAFERFAPKMQPYIDYANSKGITFGEVWINNNNAISFRCSDGLIHGFSTRPDKGDCMQVDRDLCPSGNYEFIYA